MYQNTRRLSLLILSLALLVLSLTVASPRSAEAFPAQSCYCLYYSDATYTTIVGEKFGHCDGSIDIEGIVTSYKTCQCETCIRREP